MGKIDIRDIKAVETSSGRPVKARYLDLKDFDHHNNLCFELHRVFLFSSKDRASSNAYLLNQAIEKFLIFIKKYNGRQPEGLKVDSLSKVNSEVFKAFIRYCQKNKIPFSIPTRLKGSIINFAEETRLIPIPLLPSIRPYNNKRTRTEPLDDACYSELTRALMYEIDHLYEKVNFIEKVNNAKPYTLAEAYLEIFPPKTKERVFLWYEMILKKEITSKFTIKALSFKLRDCTDEELSNLVKNQDPQMLDTFKAIYQRDKEFVNTSQVDPFIKTGLINWNFDLARGLKTLLVHGYPMHKTLDEIKVKYSNDSCLAIDRCEDIIQLLILRVVRSPKQNKHPEIQNWDSFLGMYFPSMIDSASIYLMLALQTGWNKETILSIDPNNYEHVLTGAISENQSLIFSEKHRGQDSNLAYSHSKEFIASSDKDDKYSIYNVIQLAKKITSPLQGYKFDYLHMYHQEEDLNTLFLCLRYWADWVSKGGRHTSISQNKAFQTAIRHFINKHKIKEHGKQISVIGDITLRIRVTWMQIKRKKLPLTIVRLVQGHSHKDTTDKYYDNSGAANKERKKRLRIEQEKIITLLRNREFKGIIGTQANNDATASLKIFHIPGQKNILWGCANQYNPTWHGAETEITKEEKCYSISNCLFCKQIRLFEDSVPYLMERLIHIDGLMTDVVDPTSILYDEKVIIESILDNWNDEDHVKLSARYQRKYTPLLPRNLNDLKIIFEDDDA